MSKVAVISVLGSLYGAVTVGLRLFLERARFRAGSGWHRHDFPGNFSHSAVRFLFSDRILFSTLSLYFSY